MASSLHLDVIADTSKMKRKLAAIARHATDLLAELEAIDAPSPERVVPSTSEPLTADEWNTRATTLAPQHPDDAPRQH